MNKRFFLLSLFAAFLVVFMLFCSTGYAENIDPYNDGSQYAYGENVGWINFEPSFGPGVTVTSSDLTGYAWSENIGWINLNPLGGGITNDGQGNLSGYAWAENVGWISFSCENANSCETVYYGVKINPATGEFGGYAWAENIGWINFAPNGVGVKTSWRGEPGTDQDGDGYLSNVDCDDTDPNVHPDAPEVCNGIDDNCADGIDEGCSLYYRDSDGDGFGDPNDSISYTLQPPGYVIDNSDCDDGNANVHPGAVETCNGIDDNCADGIDEGCTIYYADNDQDGYGDPNDSISYTLQPPGYVTDNTDCEDSNASVYPGAIETCNGIDDNCANGVDEGFDLDSDGYTSCGGDCEDDNANVNPGVIEVCNDIDDNCADGVDEGCSPYYRDLDGDGYGDLNESVVATSQPPAYTTDNTDCDDGNPVINPGATELCNGIDDNCDNRIDEGFDQDGDGYTSCGGDCDDDNPNVNPGASELCNGIDDNCDGNSDEEFDADGDGASDCIEDAGPNNGDSNNDENPDSLQGNVASVPTSDGQDYITLVVPEPATLSLFATVQNPDPDNTPHGVDFPYGLLEFTINGLADDSITAILYLPDGTNPTTYYKWGPTPGNQTPHWYNFMYNGQTGAEINGNVITLYLKDGYRGDDKLTIDNAIIDLGGPGFAADISFSPVSLDFGSLTVKNSSTLTITLTNEGPADLSITGIALSDTTNYSISGSTAIIKPGDSHEVTVTFGPQSTGNLDATLDIESNDPNQPTVIVQLLGQGAAAGGGGDGGGGGGCFIRTTADNFRR